MKEFFNVFAFNLIKDHTQGLLSFAEALLLAKFARTRCSRFFMKIYVKKRVRESEREKRRTFPLLRLRKKKAVREI